MKHEHIQLAIKQHDRIVNDILKQVNKDSLHKDGAFAYGLMAGYINRFNMMLAELEQEWIDFRRGYEDPKEPPKLEVEYMRKHYIIDDYAGELGDKNNSLKRTIANNLANDKLGIFCNAQIKENRKTIDFLIDLHEEYEALEEEINELQAKLNGLEGQQ